MNGWWNAGLETKPDFERCMQRVHAWYEQQVIDRPLIRFSSHNSEYNAAHLLKGRSWSDLKSRWFDSQFQLEYFLESIKGRAFNAETFPFFWPNLGPEVYAAFYGGDLEYEEVTSYYTPTVKQWRDMEALKLNMDSPYIQKLDELTRRALEVCDGRFLVGYTDLHPGIDCAAAWRDPQQLCMDLITDPDQCLELIRKASTDFQKIFDRFDRTLKAHCQPSITWMGIPSFGKMHIPGCDFSSLISPRMFEEFILPSIAEEIKPMDHNVFHCDGKGVAKNLDRILELPEINAVQYVQGVGDDMPIMQWIGDLKKIQNAGKSIVLNIKLDELDDIIEVLNPEGVFLCISADENLQPDIIRRVERW